MSIAGRLAVGALVAAFSVAGLWANDAWGMGHHASDVRIVCVLVAAPLAGALLARLVIPEARACSIPVLALSALAGLVAGLVLKPLFMAPYGRSVLARWLEAAPPPPPYLYPSRGGLAFVFLVSWLAGTAATYCRARQKPAGRLSIGLSTRPWNEESRAATFLNPGAPHAAGNRE